MHGIFPPQLLRDAVHFVACLIDRHTRLQTRDYVAPVAHVTIFEIQRPYQYPQWRRALMHEILARDADHGVRFIVEIDLLADDIWIARESFLPECVADDR